VRSSLRRVVETERISFGRELAVIADRLGDGGDPRQ
jgi:hypothetical protein